MLRIKMIIALLACCTLVGSVQNSTNAQSQPPATSRPMVHVSAAVLGSLVESKALPRYPEEALTKGIQGNVVFKIVVDETGKILRAEPEQGDPLLISASTDALRDYRFRPYVLNGNPIGVESQIGFHFTLSRKGDSTEGHVECLSTVP
jgi:TonB family protein